MKIKLDNAKGRKKILIRVPNWIGDGVLSIPATEAVKKAFPDAELTVITRPWVTPVYYNNPGVDAIIEYDINGRHRGLAGKWRLIEDIKRASSDVDLIVTTEKDGVKLKGILPNGLDIYSLEIDIEITEKSRFKTCLQGLILKDGDLL